MRIPTQEKNIISLNSVLYKIRAATADFAENFLSEIQLPVFKKDSENLMMWHLQDLGLIAFPSSMYEKGVTHYTFDIKNISELKAMSVATAELKKQIMNGTYVPPQEVRFTYENGVVTFGENKCPLRAQWIKDVFGYIWQKRRGPLSTLCQISNGKSEEQIDKALYRIRESLEMPKHEYLWKSGPDKYWQIDL